MTDFEREERAFRTALVARAGDTPITPIKALEAGRRRIWPVLAAVAAVIALVVGLSQLARPGAPDDPAPAPATPTSMPTSTGGRTPTPSEESRRPAGIAAQAMVTDVAVTSGAVDSRAVAWQSGRRATVAVTDDGFGSRSLHEFRDWVDVEPLGDGRFAVVSETQPEVIWVVDVEGTRSQVRVDPAESPARSGEVLLATGGGQVAGVLAVDPSTTTAHRVSLPAEATSWTAFGGRIQAAVPPPTIGQADDVDDPAKWSYHWSDDGGASWQSATLIGNQITMFEPVPTPAGAEHVVMQTSDGATMAPFEGVHTMPSTGGGFSSTGADLSGGMNATYGGAFVDAGEQLLIASLWDGGSGPPAEVGVYRIDDGALERVRTNIPDVVTAATPQLVGREIRDGADPAVWISAPDGRLHRSEDGGSTWQKLPGG